MPRLRSRGLGPVHGHLCGSGSGHLGFRNRDLTAATRRHRDVERAAERGWVDVIAGRLASSRQQAHVAVVAPAPTANSEGVEVRDILAHSCGVDEQDHVPPVHLGRRDPVPAGHLVEPVCGFRDDVQRGTGPHGGQGGGASLVVAHGPNVGPD